MAAQSTPMMTIATYTNAVGTLSPSSAKTKMTAVATSIPTPMTRSSFFSSTVLFSASVAVL
ncbi:MAG: hypothetical protein SPD80_01240 [Atopobium sp.]|nr:hypothetical protein [Atopobium sp.]MDY4522204.1 hypothetical protein [Atopobium sp.]